MKPSVSDVRKAASLHFGVSEMALAGISRTAAIAHARIVTLAVARKVTSASLAKIASHFGARDHTTILHSARVAKVRPDMADDCTAVAALAWHLFERRHAGEVASIRESIKRGEIIPAQRDDVQRQEAF